jgi:hypothetical protein
MSTLVFLLEDRSMKELLEGLLPRLLPEGVEWKLIPHEGKSDLDRSIPRKLRAWQDPNARFVILRDQDSDDCRALKARLQDLCEPMAPGRVLVRSACSELESWYLGDLSALDRAFSCSLSAQQGKRKYRDPDVLGSPSAELARLVPRFAKVSGARAPGAVLSLDANRSRSFAHFVAGVRRHAAQVVERNREEQA